MPMFSIYDTVRVVKPPLVHDVSLSVHTPCAGDIGVVVMAYDSPKEGYTVESIAKDGRAEWLADFQPEQLERV